MMNGSGSMSYGKKSYYKGNFVNSQRQGKGILYIDTEKFYYIGDFHNDQKHGIGRATVNGIEAHFGKWENDEIC